MRGIYIDLDYIFEEITDEEITREFIDRNLGELVNNLTREDVVDLCLEHDICIIDNEEPRESELEDLTDGELDFLMDLLRGCGMDTAADDIYHKLKSIRFQQL